MIKVTTLGAAAAVAGGRLLASAGEPPKRRPNLVVVFSDQQHWKAAGFQDRFFQTPNLDKLAAGATVFERAFCNTPQCSPTRSSMLTGLYPSKTGVMGNVGAAGGNALRQETIGAWLKAAGYHTGYFGKWHLGNNKAAAAGWDEAMRQTNDAKALAGATAFIKGRAKQADRPFAMFVSFNDPHDVYHFKPGAEDVSGMNVPLSKSWEKETFNGKPPVHKQFMTDNQGKLIWGRPREVWQEYRDFYRRKVRLYDACAGKVLDALAAGGLADSTIVVATSDHGDMDTNHKLIFKGPFMYEHMVRVPMVVRVPRAFGGGKPARTDYPVLHTDLVPTLLDFAGGKGVRCDGTSLRPLLTGTGEMPKREFVIGQYYGKQQWVNPIRMIRTDRYKYNCYTGQPAELYDLREDPEELTNLAEDAARRNLVKQLKSELDAWIAANDDPFHSLKPVPLRAKKRGKA